MPLLRCSAFVDMNDDQQELALIGCQLYYGVHYHSGDQWVNRQFRCHIYLGVNRPIPHCQYCLERADATGVLPAYAHSLIFVGDCFRNLLFKNVKLCFIPTILLAPCIVLPQDFLVIINDGFYLIPRLFTKLQRTRPCRSRSQCWLGVLPRCA